MFPCTSEAPLGWKHLLSYPKKLGASVKANETGFCVCASPAAPGECEQQTENTLKTLKSQQTGHVRIESFFPRLLKRYLVARQLMALLKGAILCVDECFVRVTVKLWSNTDPRKPPACKFKSSTGLFTSSSYIQERLKAA